MDEGQQLEEAINALEAQRDILGDAVVEASIAALQKQLADLTSRQSPKQQRKLVTLLFADMVGSTKIGQHLDPEEVLEIMDNAMKRLAAPVDKHGGHVTRFMGDGFKAVFGSPQAHENDPEMAVHAGLDILEAAQDHAKALEERWGIRDFKVRVGINTGLVAIGGLTEAEDTIMGSTVNLAARMESAAPPGCLLISHNTYRHVRGMFDVESLTPIEVKGFDEPMPVYLVSRPKPRTFRVKTHGVEGVETRMVGRKVELLALQEAFRNAVEGEQTQVVTMVGEAGVGKSRLLYEFDIWIEHLPDKVRFFHGRGMQETQQLPYALLKDVFNFRFQIQESDSASEVRKKLEAGFGEVLGSEEEGKMRAHIIGQLLGFDISESHNLKGILDDPQQLRDRALMYLGEYFLGISAQAPMVILLEDIHWGDDSSLDMINHLARRIQEQQLLIVCVARHTLFERRPYWGEGLDYHTQLELRPLSKYKSHGLVKEILRKVDHVPKALQDLVVKGAEGNPFYIEELIKMLVEDDVILTGEEVWHIEPDRLAEIEVPDTLTGVLQARLEGLPPEERTTLQHASIIGHIFWDDLVEYINNESETSNTHNAKQSTVEILSSLRSRDLIFRREESTFVDTEEYTFKHAVLRGVIYESVLKRLRRAYHGLVADWLIDNGGERVREYTGLIADHLELAGRIEQAIVYLHKAGDQAAKQYANEEAIGYYQRALALTDQPATQMDAYLGLGRAFILLDDYDAATAVIQKGLHLAECHSDKARRTRMLYAQAQIANRQHRPDGGKPEVEAALIAAEQAGDDYHLAQSLLLLTEVHESSGDLSSALETATRAQIVSSKLNNNPLEARILVELGFLHAQRADFDEAVNAAERGLTLLAETADRSAIAYAWNILGRALGGRGDYSLALDAFHRSQEEAHTIGDRYLLAQTSNMLGWLHRELGDYENALKFDEEGIDFAQRWDKPSPEISARLNVCLDMLHLGKPGRVLVLLDEIEVRINAGAFGFHNWRWRLRLLHARGSCFLALGEPAKALALAEEGLPLAETTGINKYVALNHELKGVALAALGMVDEAISELETAVALADAIQYQPTCWASRQQLAELYRQTDREQEAQKASSDSVHIIQTIAAALKDETLRTTFLNTYLPQ